jgi:uncharacterized membrane protein YedE/YeeE
MNHLPSLVGGLLIGLSALILYAAIGRIAGISGITFGLYWGEARQRPWRLAFVGGLIAGAWIAIAFGLPVPRAAAPTNPSSILLLLIAGVLVGFGTRMGNGCTSGHGICGVARFSKRSLVAVAVFMGIGMLTATLLRPLWL